MTGLEVLAFLVGCFASGAAALMATIVIGERRKQRFLGTVALQLDITVSDVESGDVTLPLSFTVGDVRVRAVVRGDVEVWQLERHDVSQSAAAIAVVYGDWRAPGARELSLVGRLTSRLQMFTDDEPTALSLLSRARSDLARVLGKNTRHCLVGRGRAFLEVTRCGFALGELLDAMAALDALMAVVAGESLPVLFTAPARTEHAVAGPAGVPVPALL